jgi:tripartite-type tricarboxylate transporter receptor subunit TctC
MLSWIGLFAPAGTPQSVVARLNAGIVEALADPQLRGQLAKVAFEPVGGTPQALAAAIRSETARWAPLVKAAGIKFN